MHTNITKLYLILLFSIIAIAVNAQVAMNTSGNSSSISAGSFDYSIGEVITGTGSLSNVIVTQGVLQKITVNALSIQEKTFKIKTNIYPNPTSDELNIDVVTDKNVSIHFVLIETTGKVMNDFEVRSLSGELNQKIKMNDLSNGVYLLQINIRKKDGKSNQSIHQIIKN